MEKQELNVIIDKMALGGIYSTFCPNTKRQTFFSAAHGTSSEIIILGHKISLNKYRKTETVFHFLPDHDDIKL